MTNLTEAWINIYKHKNSYWCGTPNHTKSEALLHLADTENYLTTVNIEQLLKLQEENTKLKTENKWYSEQLNEAVKEVAKLKELLTMVKPVLQLEYNVTENRNLIKKINQVLGEE